MTFIMVPGLDLPASPRKNTSVRRRRALGQYLGEVRAHRSRGKSSKGPQFYIPGLAFHYMNSLRVSDVKAVCRDGHCLPGPLDAGRRSFFLYAPRWPRVRNGHGLYVSVHCGQKIVALPERCRVLRRLARAAAEPPVRRNRALKT